MRTRTNDLSGLAGKTFTATIIPCCESANLKVMAFNVTIHGPRASVSAIIHDLSCSVCDTTFHWSGDEIAVHRHVKHCFTYELHQEFIWKRHTQLSLSRLPFVSLTTYTEAMWSIIRAIDCDFVDLYTCPFGCGDLTTSPILIGDGKATTCKPGRSVFETKLVMRYSYSPMLTLKCCVYLGGKRHQKVQAPRLTFWGPSLHQQSQSTRFTSALVWSHRP